MLTPTTLHPRGTTWRADRSDRVRARFEGKDRARALHNLTTQDINNLKVGQTAEAFVTSLQGKTLGFVTVSALEDAILMRTERPSWKGLQTHFAKYLMLDDAECEDVSDSLFEFHVSGGQTSELMMKLTDAGPEANGTHAQASISERPVLLIRESPTGQAGWTIIGQASDRDVVAAALENAGAVEIDQAVFEALRIAGGTPASGIDVAPDNLPQEFNRDSQAIHFRKGCYLGQETVARLDALGHVNKILRGIVIESAERPPIGTVLESEGKTVGTVLSSAIEPGSRKMIALAMIRVKNAAHGTRLTLANDGGVAEIRELPMRFHD